MAPDFGRRLRAAMVLADKSAEDLIEEVGPDLDIGLTTLQRMMSGRRTPRKWEVPRLATALSVPESFLVDGITLPPANGEREEDLLRELRALDSKIDKLDLPGRLAGIESELRRLGRSAERSG